MPEAAVFISDLRHRYPSRVFWKKERLALDGLSLTVEEGEIFGFLGANGAGKTTTIKILTGLLRPESGVAKLLGIPAGKIESRRMLGFMPENPYFYEYLTARETLDFYSALSGLPYHERGKRADELLEFVGLSSAKDTLVREFSKGMRQRLGIAQAVAHRPKLVILDEPMSGLDPVGRRSVREMILQLHQEGVTVFFSSHVLGDVEMLCGRVGMLANGKIAACGPVSSLLSHEALAWEVGAEGVSDTLAKETSQLGKMFRAGGIEGETLFTFVKREEAEKALAKLVEGKVKITLYRPVRETLEDYFMRTAAK